MSARGETPTTHNLDLSTYSLAELLGLFSLSSATVSAEDFKRARRKVHMMHPDKSRLAPEYFVFYQKALAVIEDMYGEQSRAGDAPVAPAQYVAEARRDGAAGGDAALARAIAAVPAENFAKTFNKLFEDNMREAPSAEANGWFVSEEDSAAARGLGTEKVAPERMGAAMDRVRAQAGGLALYRGVQTLSSMGGAQVGSFHERSNEDAYVCSDPFSALKYDDLRKVHRDQSVLAVSERDFEGARQFASVEEYTRHRDAAPAQMMDKATAIAFLAGEDARDVQAARERQFKSSQKSADYARRTGIVEAAFRLLGR